MPFMPQRKVFVKGVETLWKPIGASLFIIIFCSFMIALAVYSIFTGSDPLSLGERHLPGGAVHHDDTRFGLIFIIAPTCLFALYFLGPPIFVALWKLVKRDQYAIDLRGISISEAGFSAFVDWRNVERIGVPTNPSLGNQVAILLKSQDEYIKTFRVSEVPWIIRACNTPETFISFVASHFGRNRAMKLGQFDMWKRTLEANRALANCDVTLPSDVFRMGRTQAVEMLNAYFRAAVPQSNQSL